MYRVLLTEEEWTLVVQTISETQYAGKLFEIVSSTMKKLKNATKIEQQEEPPKK